MATLLSASKGCISFCMLIAKAVKMLSLAKLQVFAVSIKSLKKSLKKSNRTGPTINLCETPEIICGKLLLILLIRTYCFQFRSSEGI